MGARKVLIAVLRALNFVVWLPLSLFFGADFMARRKRGKKQ